jgi:hypothetical protein
MAPGVEWSTEMRWAVAAKRNTRDRQIAGRQEARHAAGACDYFTKAAACPSILDQNTLLCIMKMHFVKQIHSIATTMNFPIVVSGHLQEVRIMNSHILEHHHSKDSDRIVNSRITYSVELFVAMAALISIIGLVFFAVV